MNKTDINSYVEETINFLKETPDSFLHDILCAPVPETDDEYVSMWATYLSFLTEKIEFKASFLNHLSYERISKRMLEFEHVIFSRIKGILSGNIREKMKKMEKSGFKPRLETYLQSYSENERENIKKLLLYMLSGQPGRTFRDNISSFSEKIGIDRKWVLSLSEEHPLIKDAILEFSSLSIEDSKPLQEKDVEINFVAKKIFLGFHVSETELFLIRNSSLVEMFDLADPDFLKEMRSEIVDETDDDLEHLFDFDDNDDFDLEKMIESLESDRQRGIEEANIPIDNASELKEKGLNSEVKEIEDDSDSEIEPYESDLDYLHQEFLWVKAKAELISKKNESFRYDPDGDEKKINELSQTVGKIKNICELRLRKSIREGFIPRLIALQKKYKFSDAEINAIKAIIATELFPHADNFSSISKNSVGEILIFLFEDLKKRVEGKKYFHKKSKLVRSGIIQLEKTSLGQNLFNCNIEVDSRIVEYLRGEDFDISNYVDGTYLNYSGITMDDVIMAKDEKESYLKKIDHYPSFVKAKHKIKMPSHIQYGDAQVNLFVGPSGTGKTMLANALANYLNKKILVFNLNNYSNINYYHSPDKNLFSLLFREARMNDAILFFDEAEDLLSNRINDLLLELENHHGIVIFATNASFVVDEALRRRINHIQNFKEPGPQLRKKIWEGHLPEKIGISGDVDLDKLALRYEINGGLIKNAVFSAVANAVADSGDGEVKLKMQHLENGADEQLKNKLFMSKMETQVTPNRGFRELILPDSTLQTLQKISGHEKARKVLLGEWGFGETFSKMTGKVVLFHGPSGTGKTLAAEALAYETGKNLKMVNYAQIMSKWVGETEKALEVLMQEVAESNSILLFDEADGLFASRTNVSTVNDRYANMVTNVLLTLTENFNSIAVLTTNFLQNIDPAFYRRMELVEFEMPNEELRYKLWERLIPEKMPVADDVDLQNLARKYAFSGGDIKNAIINAASARAVLLQEIREVTMSDFLDACKAIQKQKNNGEKEIGFKN